MTFQLLHLPNQYGVVLVGEGELVTSDHFIPPVFVRAVRCGDERGRGAGHL